MLKTYPFFFKKNRKDYIRITPKNTEERDVQATVTVHASISMQDILNTISLSGAISGHFAENDFKIYPGGSNPANFLLQRGDFIFADNSGTVLDLSRAGPSIMHGITARYSYNGQMPKSDLEALTGEELASKNEAIGPSKSDINPSVDASIGSGVALYLSGAVTINAPATSDTHFGHKLAPTFCAINNLKDLSLASKIAQGPSGGAGRLMPLIEPCEGLKPILKKLTLLLLHNGHENFSADSISRINTAKTNLHNSVASIAMGTLSFLLKNDLVRLNNPENVSMFDQELFLAKALGLTSEAFENNSTLENNQIVADIIKTVFETHPERKADEHVIFPHFQNSNDPDRHTLYSIASNTNIYGHGDILSEHVKKTECINSTTDLDISLAQACVINPRAEANKIVGTILTNSNATPASQRLLGVYLNSTTVIN